MESVIFIFYLLVCTYLITSIPFFKKSGLTRLQLSLLFYIKIIAGLAYGWFYKLPVYFNGADTWRFYRISLDEKSFLIKDPSGFIKDLFIHGYSKTGGLFSGENSYWNDLKSNVLIKIMACMNVVTNSSYYTNIILFNLLFFVGLVALYRMFNTIYPGKKRLIITGIFLLPSTLFWCSGIHKDGLILSAIGLLIYNANKLLIIKDPAVKRILFISLCLVFIFPLRNYVALAIIPPLICWAIAEKYKKKVYYTFICMYALGVTLFFIGTSIHPALDFPQFIVDKQNEFRLLEGESEINLQPLKATLASFIGFLPSAVDMAFFRPHISEIKNLSYIPAIGELLLLIMLFILFCFFRNKATVDKKPFHAFIIFFSLSLLLIAGYTITFSGAIVRYRSLVLPLIITPLLCTIYWDKILRKIIPESKWVRFRNYRKENDGV